MIEVTNKDIQYAEKILLPKGKKFDRERRDFIKNLDTIDLQAVPGSGKTTALLAKLIILEKKMPFESGAGILILSHTNTAVDEIKKKLGTISPKLFQYPNFIGTIQGFVDKFLAIPHYIQVYGQRHYRIDSEIYDKAVTYYHNSRTDNKLNNGFYRRNGLDEILKIRFDNNWNLIPSIGKRKDEFFLKNKDSDTYKAVISMKQSLLNDGFLHFEDAYFLANGYVLKNPKIKKLLQKRFQYVFVDEMQDMDKHQNDLLEDLFYKKHILKHCYQRIGDINQAIHNSILSEDCWAIRKHPKRLSGSHRLSKATAKAVKYVGLEYIEIDGLRKDSNLKPIIIFYNDPSNILEEFSKLIKENNLDIIPTDMKFPFRAIGWTSHKAEDTAEARSGKTKIQDYHSSFDKTRDKPKIDYKSMNDYLICYKKSENPLAPIRKNILNIFIRILRIEGCKKENGRSYGIRDFWNILKYKDPQYEDFKKKLLEWCLCVYKKDDRLFEIMKVEIESFFENRIDIFEIETLSDKSKCFLNNDSELIAQETTDTTETSNNIYKDEKTNVEIKVGNVHSVKGETHIATLYMESFYYKDSDKSYESQRLSNQFNGEKLGDDVGKRIQQSAKMAYVGFSRPTHLLCFAVHESRLEEAQINRDIWDIANRP